MKLLGEKTVYKNIMDLKWKNLLNLIGLTWIGLTAAIISESTYDEANYPADAIITRDVCVIGGGSSGTYSAIRLRDLGQSVVVVERENRLGGHTHTYIDPATQGRVDFGVVAWHDLHIVKEYFARFDVPLTKQLNSFGSVQYVDLSTGEVVTGYSPGNATEALAAYGAQLAKYPYVEASFDLPDPVPAELLLPFGDFVKKYALDAALQVIVLFTQGSGDLLRLPTLYVMKLFGLDVLRNLQVGFLTTERRYNSELYEKAGAELGEDVLLQSRVVAMRRNAAGYAKILIETPSGRKLIRAKKILLTIPPKLENLVPFDLDETERSLFGQFQNSVYYTGVLRNTGIPDNTSVFNIGVNSSYNLPALPGVYTFLATGVPGLHDVKYGSPQELPVSEVKADILASVDRMRTAGTLPTNNNAEFAAFESHSPFELTVPADAIQAGFYRQLYGLQGRNGMFYTGATFHTHDSSLLWQFSEALLPRIVGNSSQNQVEEGVYDRTGGASTSGPLNNL